MPMNDPSKYIGPIMGSSNANVKGPSNEKGNMIREMKVPIGNVSSKLIKK